MPALVEDRRRAARGVLATGVVVAAAALVALVAQRSPAAALVVALVPVLVLLSSRPVVVGVLGVGLVPLTTDVLPGLPLKVSLSDAFLLVALLATAALGTHRDWAVLRPVLPFVGVYALALVPSLAAHPDPVSLVSSAQRLQIVLVPLAVGAVVLRHRGRQAALTAYVLVAGGVGLLFGFEVLPASLELQKNPVGGFVAGAVLVAVADPSHRLRLLTLPFLAVGLFQSESRGAVLGLLVGFVALVLTRPGATRLRTAALLLPVLVVLGLAFAALPDDVQERTTTFVAEEEQPAAQSGAQYTIRIREAYREDALELVRANPVAGVGVGQYRSGNAADGTLVDDPHQVLLLEAAEGGLPLLAGFAVLLAGSSVVLWRLRRQTPLAGTAIAVQASTVAHAMVDVYWVRGTPVLGWLLVGMALVDAARRRTW